MALLKTCQTLSQHTALQNDYSTGSTTHKQLTPRRRTVPGQLDFGDGLQVAGTPVCDYTVVRLTMNSPLSIVYNIKQP